MEVVTAGNPEGLEGLAELTRPRDGEQGPAQTLPETGTVAGNTSLVLLASLSFCHLCNDLAQSLLPAIYPLLKTSFSLNFRQIGLITLTYQLTASILQPLIGLYTDRRPFPYALPFGMCFTAAGLLLISRADVFGVLLVGASILGIGSSVFHPEASRVARLASGGRFGFAQSLFQVGGNFGAALGPLLAAFAVMSGGQHSIAWFLVVAPFAIWFLWRTGSWYKARLALHPQVTKKAPNPHPHLRPAQVKLALAVLLTLIFSKYILSFEFDQLLHLLLDSPVSRFGTKRTALSVPFPGGSSGRDHGGWPHRRSHRKKIRDLVFHLGMPSIHVAVALCQFVLDGNSERGDRADSIVSIFRHRRIWAGTDAGQCRNGGRVVLRFRIRHWRYRGCGAGPGGRSYEHRVRL